MCSGIADIAVAETGGADAGTDRTSSDIVDVEANGVVLLVEVLHGQLIATFFLTKDKTMMILMMYTNV